MASRVSGHKQAARNIRSLVSTLQRPVSEASRYALKPLLAASKRNLLANGSYITGDLYKGMKIRQLKKNRTSNTFAVGATGKAIPEAHLVEFGTAPHWQPKRGVMHPGAKPYPFLSPAYASHDKEAIERFGEKLGPALEAQAARVGRRSK